MEHFRTLVESPAPPPQQLPLIVRAPAVGLADVAEPQQPPVFVVDTGDATDETEASVPLLAVPLGAQHDAGAADTVGCRESKSIGVAGGIPVDPPEAMPSLRPANGKLIGDPLGKRAPFTAEPAGVRLRGAISGTNGSIAGGLGVCAASMEPVPDEPPTLPAGALPFIDDNTAAAEFADSI